MEGIDVAIVSRSEHVRRAAAAAFDRAPASWRVTVHTEPVTADVVVCGPDDGVAGAIVFDFDEPGSLVDRVMSRAPNRRGRVYVVTGLGGGVGASTLALHLGATLGRGCVVLDLDVTWGSACRLGLDRREVKTWSALDLADGDSVRSAALPVSPGFRVLLAPWGADEVPARLLVDAALTSFDRVVVDAPRASVEEAMSSATALVQVVASCRAGLHRARDTSSSPQGLPTALVLNRTGPGGSVTKARAERFLERKVSIDLPLTPALRDAEEDAGLLVGPWTRYVRKVTALARALEAL